MKLDKRMPVVIDGNNATIFGGPFRNYIEGTRRMVGVKMAMEIDHPCDISIPTEDFSVPDLTDMMMGITDAITAISKGNDLYVGCMGGIGRTGLFMGCLVKTLNAYAIAHNSPNDCSVPKDPILFVRSTYYAHAIETKEQMEFVRNFNCGPIVKMLMKENHPPQTVKTIKVYVETLGYPPLFEYLGHWFKSLLGK